MLATACTRGGRRRDGRYLFTLYITSNGAAMAHELDLQTATARCIDLPGTGPDGRLWKLA